MKIALVLNDDFSMWHFRKGLIKALVADGHEVSLITPDGPYVNKLQGLGAVHIDVKMKRFISFFSDILLFLVFFKVLRSGRFDCVHNMTIKPNIYGTLAAGLAGVPKRVCLVSGAGFVFSEDASFKARCLRFLVSFMYRFSMFFCHKVWFQNPDDMEQFVTLGIIPREKGVVILSGGIDTEEFAIETVNAGALLALRDELKIDRDARCVVMIAARMIWSKGVREFAEAAGRLIPEYPGWHFIMLCPREVGSPDAVPQEYINSFSSDRFAVIDTFRTDVKMFIALADIFVLPSYYKEGVPRALLEALSMSRSVVTTDSVGCRETVADGINGYLAPVKDSNALAARIRELMDDPSKRASFGKRGRERAISMFSEKTVFARVFSELYGVGNVPN